MKTRTLHFLLLAAALALPSLAAAATTPAEPVTEKPEYLFKLTYEDAEKAIGDALAEKGAGGKIAATITGRKGDDLFSYSRPITVEIRGLTFDAQEGNFNASLLAVAEGEVITASPVTGRYEETINAPVLKRQVRNGEVIREDDIEMREFPVARTRTGTITDKAELVGMSPARTISAMRPIRDHEIDRPTIVKKNSIVQMRYISPGMEITTTGQAMDDAAKGALVSVRNLSSKKVVQAVVSSENVVNVMPSSPQSASIVSPTAEAIQLKGEAHANN